AWPALVGHPPLGDDVSAGQFWCQCHASTPARSGPRSSLAAILTRVRLSVMLRLPLAPVLARPSLRSSLAFVSVSCFDSRSLRSSLVPLSRWCQCHASPLTVRVGGRTPLIDATISSTRRV